jgi:hypothetical protein
MLLGGLRAAAARWFWFMTAVLKAASPFPIKGLPISER